MMKDDMRDDIKSWRRKLKKAKVSGNLLEISDCSCTLASFLTEEGEHEEALQLYKLSRDSCEALGNKEGVALANRMMAEEYVRLGCFDEALAHADLYLKYATDEKNKVEEQRALVLKGFAYFTEAECLIDANSNDNKKIKRLLEQSMNLYRKSFFVCMNELNHIDEKERLKMKARLLQNKSLVFSRQGQLDSAQAHLIKAIKICAKEKFNETEHLCYLNMGDLHIKKEEPHKALKIFQKAFEISHSTQKKQDSLSGQAKSYVFMDDFEEAKKVLKKAIKIKPNTEIKDFLTKVRQILKWNKSLCSISDTDFDSRVKVYKKLGNTYYSLKCNKKAVRNYLNMLNCAQKQKENKKTLIKCYEYLCKVFTNDKEYDKALFYCNQAVETISKFCPEKSNKILIKMGILQELNESGFDDIKSAFLRAKTKAQLCNHFKLQVKCLKHLIRIGNEYDKPDLVEESEKELKRLKDGGIDPESSCDSGNHSDSDDSTEDSNEESSDSDFENLISDVDADSEEVDRSKRRCKRSNFKIKRNEKGETELHLAAIKGNYNRVKLLVEKGHPVNIRDSAGWTPLHEASNYGYVDIVNFLLDFGADINDKGCDGTTPLHDAATNGRFQVIETLIKRGASTLVLDDNSQTPLQILLAWKKTHPMDAEEDALFKNIVEMLKSPLDSEDIRRHLRTPQSLPQKIQPEATCSKNLKDSVTSKNVSKPKETSAVSEYKEAMRLLRRKRTPSSDSGDSKESSEDEDIFQTSRKKSKAKKKSACEEYRKADEELSRKSKKRRTDVLTPKPKSAFIDEEEYVENCIVDSDEEEEEAEKSEEENEIEVLCGNLVEKHKKKDKTLKRKKIIKSPKSVSDKLKKENPRIEEPTIGDNELSASVSKEKESNNNGKEETIQEPKKIEIKIKFFDEKIQILVDESKSSTLKSDWLIWEVAKRRPGFEHENNFAVIKVEGKEMEETATVADVAGKEIEIHFTKWKSMPLSERYEKVCTIFFHPDITTKTWLMGYKYFAHPQVVEEFKNSSKSRCLTLSNLKLSPVALIPICKTLKFEPFIQVLNLSNNLFGDKGIELIVNIFDKCIVQELNLSNCNISSLGLYHFNSFISRANDLSKNGFEDLDFSHNPITEDAVPSINNIIQQLHNLKKINIEHCELITPIKSKKNSNLVIIQSDRPENVENWWSDLKEGEDFVVVENNN